MTFTVLKVRRTKFDAVSHLCDPGHVGSLIIDLDSRRLVDLSREKLRLFRLPRPQSPNPQSPRPTSSREPAIHTAENGGLCGLLVVEIIVINVKP